MNISVIKLNPVARAVSMFAAIAVLATGVTYAALSSQATLTDSTINTASADLTLWNGSEFVAEAPGFTVTNLVPGTGVTRPLYLRNGGAIPLNVTLRSSVPESNTGFDQWSDVKVSISSNAPGCGEVVETNLQQLIDQEVGLPCNPLDANSQGNSAVPAEGNYDFKFDIPASEVSGSSASVGAFDLTLTGTQL